MNKQLWLKCVLPLVASVIIMFFSLVMIFRDIKGSGTCVYTQYYRTGVERVTSLNGSISKVERLDVYTLLCDDGESTHTEWTEVKDWKGVDKTR